MQQNSQLIVLLGSHPGDDQSTQVLDSEGYRVGRASDWGEASRMIQKDRPALIVRTWESASSNGSPSDLLPSDAMRLGISLLDIVEDDVDPAQLIDRQSDADDWLYRSRVEAELAARVGRLLRRGHRHDAPSAGQAASPIDSRFLALVVHDLRTPLNVVSLSLRMIDQTIPRNDPDLLEDLKFVEENFKQIERMLAQLSDYCRLYENDVPLTVAEFSPARLIEELVEERAMKAAAGSPPLQLRIEESCPPDVSLDPGRARLAIQYVLSNALASTQDIPVEIVMRGDGERLITEARIDRPPPPSVKSVGLRPDSFERLCGTAAERRGLDLAIAARVSEMFGGSARLAVVEDRETSVILDWPTRLPTT